MNVMLPWLTLLLLLLARRLTGLAIDNGVEGDPEIECGATGITVNINTQNSFEGHVFVKGRYGEAGCRTDRSGTRVASITLPFTACGIERQRSLNPRGIFIGVSVVISFHPQFLTKVDRAYSVQCFYMEADKTVSQELEVSEITTAFQTQVVPMPVCSYSVLDGGPNGEPIKYALIGQTVYHKWTCETEAVDIFCMIVHSCFVDDGAANRIQLLNEQGCALDRFLLNNLEYISDLMAGKDTMVFKFADKAALIFECQISIAIKEPDQQCPRPQCPEAGGAGSSPGSAPGLAPTAVSQVTAAPVSVSLNVRTTVPPQPTIGGGSPPAHKPLSPAPAPPPAITPAAPAPAPAAAAATLPSAPSAAAALPVLAGANRSVPAAGSLLAVGAPSSAAAPAAGPPGAATTAAVVPPSAAAPTRIPAQPELPQPPEAAGRFAATPAVAAAAAAAATGAPPPRPAGAAVAANRPVPAPAAAAAAGPAGPAPRGDDPKRFDFESTFPFRLRRVRSIDDLQITGTWDVRSQPITAFDNFDEESPSMPPNLARLSGRSSTSDRSLYCLSPLFIGLSSAITLLSLFILTTATLSVCLNRRFKRQDYVD